MYKSFGFSWMAVVALLATGFSTACDGASASDAGVLRDARIVRDGALPSVPRVVSTTPLASATDVATNTRVRVEFSEPMRRTSLDATTFTLTMGEPPVAIPGVVIAHDLDAVFLPAAHLPIDTEFSATVTVGALSRAGTPLAAAHVFRFTTGDSLGPLLPVDLGAAGDFVILAQSGISTVPTSAVTGDIGVSPAAATAITGFDLTLDIANEFATSAQVTGSVYASDYATPTPATMTAAIGDMGLAFTDAAGRAPDVTGLGAGTIGGMTLAPGVYAWGTSLLITSDITLMGSATDVWIFQIAGELTMASGVRVTLAGDALARNIFWKVSELVDLGTTAHCEGIILTQTAVTLRTGASINGRLLAQTAVDIAGSTVVEPTN